MLIKNITPRFLITAFGLLSLSTYFHTQALAELPEVAEGFEIRLFAAVPAATFPCQVATAPDGSLFVAEDPMDQVGPHEADHGRIVRFAPGPDGKPSPDQPTTFADNLRAVFGMAWHNGSLYVMHMPYLSIFKDTNGDGKADQRKDLFTDLGPGPKSLNDHIVSGLQFGMDGWLYISVGDKGVPGATRPEDGRKVQIKGGGTLRCRPDGTGLEVISSGTRNHLEPNLDSHDNLFTYDNTDDGDGWWTRVTHHIDGGYYGYAYDYHNFRHRMLDRIAEYGGGSPCGGVVYKDDIWPARYRDMAFWAEWGKREVRGIRFKPKGASFEIDELVEFVKPGKQDSFRPIDLALSSDGSTLYIADWSMGGWNNKTEKLGRIYAVSPKSPSTESVPRGKDSDTLEDHIRHLSHPAFGERMRAQKAIISLGHSKPVVSALQEALANPKTPELAKRHLIWALEGVAGGGPDATMPIIAQLQSATEASVRAQAARALGLRQAAIAVDPLIKALDDKDPSVRLQALIALGRLGDETAIDSIVPHLGDTDPYISFAARIALRRIGQFEKIAQAGLSSTNPLVRKGTLVTLEQQYDKAAVKALASFASNNAHPVDERAMALTYLSEVHRKTAPWDGSWWGTRPTRGKVPAKDINWDNTDFVLDQLRNRLDDPAPQVRLAAIGTVAQTRDAKAVETLRARLKSETDTPIRYKLIEALAALQDAGSIPALASLSTDSTVGPNAMKALGQIGTDAASTAILETLTKNSAAITARTRIASLDALASTTAKKPVETSLDQISGLSADANPQIRSALINLFANYPDSPIARSTIRKLMDDKSGDVVKSALNAIGRIKDTDSIPALLKRAGDSSTRFDAMAALTEMPDPRAIRIYLAGLTEKNPQLRRSSSAAFFKVRDAAVPILEQLSARKELPGNALPELRKIYTKSQPVTSWHLIGPFAKGDNPDLDPSASVDFTKPMVGRKGTSLQWKQEKTRHPEGMVDLSKLFGSENDQFAFGIADFNNDSPRKAKLVVGSDDTLTVWLNGVQVYDYKSNRGWQADSDSIDVDLKPGSNRVVIRCGNGGGPWQFSLGVTDPANYAFLNGPAPGQFDAESFRKQSLAEKGDAERGLKLFADTNGLACIKCHAVSGKGGAVGPDLTGLAVKYTLDEIASSILYPSAKIASGYESYIVATKDGRVITGVLKADTTSGIDLEDADAKRIHVPLDDIEERRPGDVSIMPNGLAEGLKPKDFADLLSYLMTLREAAKPTTPATKSAGGD